MEYTERRENLFERHQEAVDRHFESAAPYWGAVYEDLGLEGTIYQLRRSVVLELVKWLNLPKGETALEVGCGVGVATVRLARMGFRVEAIDTVGAMTEMTRQRATRERVRERIRVLRGDAHNLRFDDGRFALVLAVGIMPWLHSPRMALQEIVRVLKPGGFLIITADNRWHLPFVLDPRHNPLLAPLRRHVNALLRRWHLRAAAQEAMPFKTYSINEFDWRIQSAGLEKLVGFTVGFGPFTFWRKPFLPDSAGSVLNKLLQWVACHDFPLLRSAGSQYVVVARKPLYH